MHLSFCAILPIHADYSFFVMLKLPIQNAINVTEYYYLGMGAMVFCVMRAVMLIQLLENPNKFRQ